MGGKKKGRGGVCSGGKKKEKRYGGLPICEASNPGLRNPGKTEGPCGAREGVIKRGGKKDFKGMRGGLTWRLESRSEEWGVCLGGKGGGGQGTECKEAKGRPKNDLNVQGPRVVSPPQRGDRGKKKLRETRCENPQLGTEDFAQRGDKTTNETRMSWGKQKNKTL